MTETVKHTPGPWFLEVTERNLWVGVEKAVGGKVGEVITRLDYGYDYNPWHNDMALANARLIAASPSLYEYVSRKASEGDEDAARLIAIRPAAPEPSDPSFNRVDVSALIEATRAKSLLTEECEMSPKDIMDIADHVYGQLGRGVHQDTQVIADGIAAERERCREVARKVILDARMGDIDTDLRSIGHVLDDRLSSARSKGEA